MAEERDQLQARCLKLQAQMKDYEREGKREMTVL